MLEYLLITNIADVYERNKRDALNITLVLFTNQTAYF